MDNNGAREPLAKWLEEAGKMAGKVKENTVNTMEQVKAQTTEFQRKTQEFLESGKVITTAQIWCAENLPFTLANEAIVELEAVRNIWQEQQNMLWESYSTCGAPQSKEQGGAKTEKAPEGSEVEIGDTGTSSTIERRCSKQLPPSLVRPATKVLEAGGMLQEATIMNAINHGANQSRELKAERIERLRKLMETQTPVISDTKSSKERGFD